VLYCILKLLYILSTHYECLGKGRRLERLEGEHARGDVRGPEEQGAGTVEMLFLDVVISVRHQSVDPSVPGQQSKASRGRPLLWKEWKEGGTERHAVKSIVLGKLTFLIGHKSCKFLSISRVDSAIKDYIILLYIV